MATHALIALAVASVAGLVSAFILPAVIRVAHELGLLSYPTDARQVHTRPLPRIGGLAMFIAFVAAVGVSFWFPVDRFSIEVERVALLVIGATLVVSVMLYDDLIGATARTKLLFQAAAAAIVIIPRLRGPEHGLVLDQFNTPFSGVVHVPVLLACAITFVWIIGMMNTLNWVDGLDGLAASVTLIASSVLFFHTFFRPEGDPQFTISLLPAALGGAVIGFLPYNWHPSRIIMGDVGAMFLGFTLAIISIIGGAKIATALLALWLPILDVAWVIVFRVLNGRSPAHADRGHLHHRLLDLGWSQRQIVLLFAGISAALGLSSLLIPTPEIKFYALLAAGILGVGLLAFLARRGTHEHLERPVPELTRRS